MTKTKKVWVLLMAAVMVVSLAACGGNAGSGDSSSKSDQPDAKTIIADAAQKMKDAKSLNSDMTMEIGMSANGKTMISMDTNMKISALEDPVLLKIDMTMKGESAGTKLPETTANMYGQDADGSTAIYMSADQGQNWFKQTVSSDDLSQYSAKDSMDMYLNSSSNFKLTGTEKINGSDAYKLEGEVSGDDIGSVLKDSGSLKQLTSLVPGMTEDELVKDAKAMPLTVWIDKESGYPVKYDMDMKDMMSGILDKALKDAPANQKLTVDKMKVSMTVSDFNKVEPFELPAKVKDAKETNLGL